MNVRAAHAGLKQFPKILNAVDVDPVTKVIGDGILLGTVVNGSVLEATIL